MQQQIIIIRLKRNLNRILETSIDFLKNSYFEYDDIKNYLFKRKSLFYNFKVEYEYLNDQGYNCDEELINIIEKIIDIDDKLQIKINYLKDKDSKYFSMINKEIERNKLFKSSNKQYSEIKFSI